MGVTRGASLPFLIPEATPVESVCPLALHRRIPSIAVNRGAEFVQSEYATTMLDQEEEDEEEASRSYVTCRGTCGC